MKKKVLLILLTIIMFNLNNNVYADSIKLVYGASNKCSGISALGGKTTCFKISTSKKILYCTEYYREWGTGYNMQCTPQDNTSKTRKLTYVFENGYSEYSDSTVNQINVGNSKSITNTIKNKYDTSQMAVWKIYNQIPNNKKISTEADNLVNEASGTVNINVNDILKIEKVNEEKNGLFVTGYNIKTNFKYLIHEKNKQPTAEVTLTNVADNLKDKLYVNTKKEIKSTTKKFNCSKDGSKYKCTATINLTNNVNSSTGQKYYILANSDEEEYKFNMKISIETYLNPNNSSKKPISICRNDNIKVSGNRIQHVVKYDRKPYTVSKEKEIKWKKTGCANNCTCGQTKNESGTMCCEIKECPIPENPNQYKCPNNGPNNTTSICNNGVTMLSECEKLSLEANSENNVISLKEEGTLSNVLSTNEIFAGGIINFNLIYHNILSWECKSNCDNQVIIPAIESRIKSIENVKSNIINAPSKINNSTIKDENINCYRKKDYDNKKVETICVIEYTKNTKITDTGIIKISAEMKELDVLKNPENDSSESSGPWTKEWKVKINENDPSCQIQVKQGKYNSFRYRPIDLKNPFPKNIIGINWIKWYDNNHNVNHSFDYTEDNLDNKNIEYEIEITEDIDEKIEEYK